MKAAVIRGPRKIEIEDRPTPVPGKGQALLRIRAVGICGSDIKGFSEENSKARQPGLIIGHEAAGVVVSVGTDVSKFKPGDRAAIDPQVVCGSCPQCASGWTSVCDNKKVIGSSLRGFLDGAMAEYAAIDEGMLHLLPDGLGFEEGAAVEPVSNALHAVERAGIRGGETVVVVGMGTLGLCILQAARLSGAKRIVAFGANSAFRMERARSLGADLVLRSDDQDAERIVRELTGGRGADAAIDAAGNSRALALAVALARKRGRIVAFGNAQASVEMSLLGIVNKELEIVGSSGARADEARRAIELLHSGGIRVSPIITHRFPIEETQRAFELLQEPRNEAIKIIIVP